MGQDQNVINAPVIEPNAANNPVETIKAVIATGQKAEISLSDIPAFETAGQSSGLLAGSDMRVPTALVTLAKSEIAAGRPATFNATLQRAVCEVRKARSGTTGYLTIPLQANVAGTDYRFSCLKPAGVVAANSVVKVTIAFRMVNGQEVAGFEASL